MEPCSFALGQFKEHRSSLSRAVRFTRLASTKRVLRRIEHASRSTAAAPLCIDLLMVWSGVFVSATQMAAHYGDAQLTSSLLLRLPFRLLWARKSQQLISAIWSLSSFQTHPQSAHKVAAHYCELQLAPCSLSKLRISASPEKQITALASGSCKRNSA